MWGQQQEQNGTDQQPLQSIQPACLPLKEMDASGSFALICLNMIFFLPYSFYDFLFFPSLRLIKLF